MPTQEEINARFTDQLRYVDDIAQIVLKGHLVMEELMTEAISEFLLHKNYVEKARLQFHQKLQLCRSMSVSDNENSMWTLISSVNSLRNHMSHSLDHEERTKRIEALHDMFAEEFPDSVPVDESEMPRQAAICVYSISASLGYLHAHFEEIRRLKRHVEVVVQGIKHGAL